MGRVESPLLFQGGTGRTSNPHLCPFSEKGADEAKCVDNGARNADLNKRNCCGTIRGSLEFAPCSSIWRKCWKCLEMGLTGKRANPVSDPVKGTCVAHSHSKSPSFDGIFDTSNALEAARERNRDRAKPGGDWATQQSRHIAVGIKGDSGFMPTNHGTKVERLLAPGAPMDLANDQKRRERMEMVKTLTGEEMIIVFCLAYGYDTEYMEVQRKKAEGNTASTVPTSDVFRNLFKRFDLLELGSEREMHKALGKAYLDHAEEKRRIDRELRESIDKAVDANSASAAGADTAGDAGNDSVLGGADEDSNADEEVVDFISHEQDVAEEVVAHVHESASDGEVDGRDEREPNGHEAPSEEVLPRRRVHHGFRGPRGRVVMTQSPIDTVSEGEDSVDAGEHANHEELQLKQETNMPALSIAEKKDLATIIASFSPQQRKVSDALAKGADDEALMKQLGYATPESAAQSRKVVLRALGLGGRSMSPADKRALLASVYEFVPAAQGDQSGGKNSPSRAKPQVQSDTAKSVSTAKPDASAKKTQTSHHANGNGHAVADTLMQIDLARFGDLINFDLVPLDPENLAQRSKLIAERRKHGLKLETVLSHPSWPHQQMLFVQRSEE